MLRRLTTGVFMAGVMALAGCGGGGSSPTAPAPTAAVLSVTENPNPIIAGQGAQGFALSAIFNVVVTESAGIGANVNFVNVTLRDATTGVEVGTVNLGANQIVQDAGSNHVPAKGTLTIPNFAILYTLPLGGRQATLTIALQMQDDAGNVVNRTLTVPVV